jgi:predicted benzoate:H+ symporter BenE
MPIMLYAALAGLSLAVTWCENAEKAFCIVAARKDANVCFTVHSTATGWAGFGIGKTGMNGAGME